MIHHTFLCCCFVPLFTLPAFAQETRHLSSLELDLNRLAQWGTREYACEASRPGSSEKEVAGRVILKTEVTEDGVILDDRMRSAFKGKELLLNLTHQCQKDNFLTPKRIEFNGTGDDRLGTVVATVNGGKATIRSAGKEREKELPPGVVSMSAFYRIVTLLPRQAGIRISFPYWLESKEFNLKKDFVVECMGKESLQCGQKSRSCTKFCLTGVGIRPSIYWVSDDDALRQILIDERKLMRLQDDDTMSRQ